MSPDAETRHKKLTRFLCQELLYEYVTGALDERRRHDVEEFITECRDTRRELEQLVRALEYLQAAQDIAVAPQMREALLRFEPRWKKKIRAWSLWSSQRGWRLLPYTFVGLAAILALLVLKPWHKEPREEEVLAEQLKQEPDMLAPTELEDVERTVPQLTSVPAPLLTMEAPEPRLASVLVDLFEPPPPSLLVTGSAAPQASLPKAPVTPPDTTEIVEALPGPKGELIRGQLEVTDFHNSWPAIRDKVVALGGKVAGNVELGWLRRSDEAYFHFSLPESNRKELDVFLGTFGPVRFSTERHPRVMPQGQIRIILTVKDGMTNESAPETP
ncbi:MAG: hypothetical protein AB7G93_12165 [Bdellovibrionales bacterium]